MGEILVFKKKKGRARGWEHDSVDKRIKCKYENLSSNPQHPHKKTDSVAGEMAQKSRTQTVLTTYMEGQNHL